MKTKKELILAALLMAVLTVGLRYTVFRDPPTIVWGDDFKRLHPELFKGTLWSAGVPAHFNFVRIGLGGPNYEFGLRSDGVVVWREVKP